MDGHTTGFGHRFNVRTIVYETPSFILRSKFEFSFVAPIQWGEVDKISSHFISFDRVHNSHDLSVLQSIDILKRNLMLITLS